MSPSDLKMGGHELKRHRSFQNTFHWKHLSPRLPPPNNFWPFLPNLEAHFNAEILFQGRRIMSVIWRTEDSLPPAPQPAVKSRGHKKLHQTVTCVSLQEQWQNKLLFCLVLFPIYKTFLGPDPRLLAFSLMLMSADPPPSPFDSKINWQLQTKPCVSEGTPEKSTSQEGCLGWVSLPLPHLPVNGEFFISNKNGMGNTFSE